MPIQLREIVKRPGIAQKILASDTWRDIRHQSILFTDKRGEDITFTRFIRLPSQYDALTGPVTDFLTADNAPRTLKIAVLGCSNGAEAYSIASAFRANRPEQDFSIRGSDINPEMIRKAQSAEYSAEEIYCNKMMREEFVNQTFDRSGDQFVVKSECRAAVSFEVLNALDPMLAKKVGQSDIVFAQNFLFNLPRNTASDVFKNIMTLLKPRSALFVEGMDYDMRCWLTYRYGLKPLLYKLEEIHNDARSERAAGWPYRYWGLGPFPKSRFSWKRRYATIFLRGDQ